MSDVRDALLFLDLDKGGEAPGPLFEEPRRRLEADPRLRAGWSQYQALRALGWECAPEPGEKLLRQAMLNCRRERVNRQLARSTGSDDLAREILLGRVKERRGLPGWLWAALLIAALGLGWIAFGQSFLEFQTQVQVPSTGSGQALPSAVGDEPLPFEFSAQTTPADAALAAPLAADVSDKADDMRHEDTASRQARKLLRDHLRGQEAARAEPTPAPSPVPTPPERRAAPVKPVPVARAKAPKPSAVAQPMSAPATVAPKVPAAVPGSLVAPAPTAVATALPTPVPTRAATAVPTAVPTSLPAPAPAAPAEPKAAEAAGPAEADLKLSASAIAQGGSLLITVSMPERREVDLRLFDMRGRPVRKLAEGAFGPGEARFPFDANDDAGQALKPATYYLRVMTPWFSRVEPIEIR